MATFVSVGFPVWLDGGTFNGLIGRTFDVAAMAYTSGSSTTTAVRGGVLPAGGTQALLVSAASGMNITINPGYCVVANSAAATNGGYRFGLTSQATVTVAAADVTNPRIDLVCASVVDNGDGTSFAQVLLVTGTPAPSPAVPTAPANSITLAQIAVAANAASIVAGNITDKRVFTVPPGGILPVATASVAPTGQNGSYVHDVTVGRLAHNGSAGVKQVKLLPFAPQVAVKTTNTTTLGTQEVTILSANVTTDGSTDIECTYKWSQVQDQTSTPASSANCSMRLYIDSTQVDETVLTYTGTIAGGGAVVYRTTSLLGTTPTAGAHTVSWKFTPVGVPGGDTVAVKATTVAPAQLVVKPVCQ